ncbi:peptide MFS transporter [Paramicrobacterium agarici]|uniref:POT family proton-dependent oligopeptide transporter n=1 Tax=Paramicrobacterium agarici TaxID=630514 RepID=A0A2A9DSA1_9MICO|nr:oligopeptide:H+ symporter [Microbacterium agarici]PFG29463.1 POT family proton-dependent oligopeptide transporter [Microbacterium agarici]
MASGHPPSDNVTAASTANGKKPHKRSFFGQPRELAHIFGVEMWERFSFYGMQGILIYYLYFSATEGGLGMSQVEAAGIVGAYGGGVYLSTVVGAWLADRMFGSERVLFASAIIIVCGHLALALLPGFVGVGIGLILVALGSGGLKANATSVVGTLYAPDDTRRDAGFSLFYLGINLGSFVGPIVTGALQSSVGFHIGFGAAAVGMVLGLIQYSIGRRGLPDNAREVPNPLSGMGRLMWGAVALVAIAAIVVLCLVGLIRADNLPGIVIAATVVAAIAYFIVLLTSRSLDTTERHRVYAFIPLFLASSAFWSLYQQQFTVIPIYAEQRLNLDVFGWAIPPTWVQSINPVFIILLSGAFAALWTKWGERQPSTPVKFGLGTAGVGVAFLIFLIWSGGQGATTPLLAIVLILFTFTIAELLLSPVGLSVSTKLAPRSMRAQMVALFFLSVALGSAVSGELAKLYESLPEATYFGIVGGIAIALGLIVIAISPWVLKLMRGVR